MNLRRRMEDDLARDIQEHIELATRENIDRGMAPDEARFLALRKFGNRGRVTEETYAVWHWTALDRLRQDVRYALRGLRRNPIFAAMAILTLALGIGLNTAVFSVVNAVLLRPLPYPDASRLVWVANRIERLQLEAVGGPDFLDWKEQARSFDRLASYSYGGTTLGSGADAEQIGVAAISPDFVSITGARPEAGRLFEPGDRRALLLTHKLFVRRFGGDRSAVGRTVMLDRIPYTIMGVLSEGFRFTLPTDADAHDIEALRPFDVTPQNQARGGRMSILNVIGRLKPGITVSQAYAELDTLQHNMWRDDRSGFYKFMKLVVAPLQERLVGKSRRALLVLLAAVGCVLLIACVNIANLLLARAMSRQREIAVRAAIGAGRGRMIAQVMTEGMVLALAGGSAGLLFARFVLAAVVRLGAQAVPRLDEVTIDPRVLAFTLLVACGTGILFGLGPALSVNRADLGEVLKEGGRTSSGGPAAMQARHILMAAEVAVAVVLLTGAGLLLRSFWRMNARPAGFAPERTVSMRVSLGRKEAADEVLARVGAVPGVEACGLSNARMRGFVEAEGIHFPANQVPQTVFHTISSGYFGAMGMRLVEGRWLTDQESEPAVLVNESFARRVFGDANPIGRRIRTGSGGMNIDQGGGAMARDMAAIAGVVADLRYTKLDEEAGAEVYVPYRQVNALRDIDVILRAERSPMAVAAAARRRVAAIDPTRPVYDLQTLEQALADSIAPRRFNLLLLGIFAGSALLLALVGIYGVMSYAVTQRTHEVGVRMALGAGRQQIVGMIVRQGLLVAAAGMIAGVAAALALAGVIRGMLYEVAPSDPWTFAGVCGILAAAVAAACWVPARRAAAVDPMVALRYE
jgi:putative ABC transport system permease protein